MSVQEGLPTTTSVPESRRDTVDDLSDIDYPTHSFDDIAQRMGVLDNPDIAAYYQQCCDANFSDGVSYEQGLLPIVHAFDLDHIDGMTDLELQGLGFLIADVHLKTKHYAACLYELMVIRRRFMAMGTAHAKMIEYVTDAIYDVAPHIESDAQPVVSSTILADKNLAQ